jgi:type I restriction enzyme S subunit
MKKVKLRDLCYSNKIGLYGIPAPAEDYSEKKVRYLRISDINDDGTINDNDMKSVSDNDIERYILEENDIVFARTGNSTGRAYVYDRKDGIFAFAGFLIKYGLNPDKVNPLFLRYFTISRYYKQWVKNLSVGSTRGNISAQTFADCPIILPDRKVQDSLSVTLSLLDRKIAINRAINRNLEAMAKQLYDYWFVQFDFPDENGKPYKSSGGKMVWNEKLKREIPNGWNVVNLFDAVDVQYGFPFATELFTEEYTDVPVVRIRDILEGTISAFSNENTDRKYLLKENDVVVGMDGNFHMNLWGDNISYLNQRCVRFRAKSNSPISAIQVLLETKPYIKAKEANAKGSTVGHLSDKDLKGIFIMQPIGSISHCLRDRFDIISKMIIGNRKEIKVLTKQRDELLPLLMNGQVTVTPPAVNCDL